MPNRNTLLRANRRAHIAPNASVGHHHQTTQLGDGRSGIVRRCVDLSTSQPLACKIVDKTQQTLEEAQREIDCLKVRSVPSPVMRKAWFAGSYRGTHEAATHARTHSTLVRQVLQDTSNVVKLLDVFEDPKSLYIVQELCSGGELYDVVCEKSESEEVRVSCMGMQRSGTIRFVSRQASVPCRVRSLNPRLL